jgi:signal transduction histidine kinase
MRISDTGYGIKKEDFDKMFTKFNRLDDATDNAIEGTGLGLV